jgi:hypothetical protein
MSYSHCQHSILCFASARYLETRLSTTTKIFQTMTDEKKHCTVNTAKETVVTIKPSELLYLSKYGGAEPCCVNHANRAIKCYYLSPGIYNTSIIPSLAIAIYTWLNLVAESLWYKNGDGGTLLENRPDVALTDNETIPNEA